MNEIYEVKYHTKPSPALTYYEGTIRVVSTDEETARQQAIKQLAWKAPEYRNSIVIDEVTPA